MLTLTIPSAENKPIAKIVAVLFLSLCCLGLPVSPSWGSALGDAAAQMKSGDWVELATNGFNSGQILVPPSADGNIIEYTDEAVWDPVSQRIYIIGCSRASGDGNSYACDPAKLDNDQKWIAYNVNTNTWETLPKLPFRVFPHSYDHAALDPQTGDYYFHPNDSAEAWRYSKGQWTQLPNIPTKLPGSKAFEFFPDLGGIIVTDPVTNGGQFYLYKPSTNQWTTIPSGVPVSGGGNVARYSKKYKIMYIASGAANPNYLLIMDAQGKTTRAADAPVMMGILGNSLYSVTTVDPLSGNLLVFVSNKDYPNLGSIGLEYDPVKNTWALLPGTHPFDRAYDMMTVGASLSEYGVNFFVKWDFGSSKVYLYKRSPGTVIPPVTDTTPPAKPVGLTVK